MSSLHNVEDRLRRFLKRTKRRKQEQAVAQGRLSEDDCLEDFELLENTDTRRIERRAIKLLERMHSSTGMYHLSEQDRAKRSNVSPKAGFSNSNHQSAPN